MPAPLTKQQINAFRHTVCETATRQLATRGVDKVSMRSLAEELGCSATMLYSYFSNKDELVATTRTAAYNRLSKRLEQALATTTDPWQQSRAIGTAYLAFAREEPESYRLIFAFRQPCLSDYPKLAAADERSRRCLTGYIENMVNAGLLEGDPEILAHLFWSAMHGLIQLDMAGKFEHAGLSFDVLRHEMMRLITRGARADLHGNTAAATNGPPTPYTHDKHFTSSPDE